MAVFVLVHGAWHGGWCWDRVRPLLESEGHQVVTPTLTGLAERADELTREVNLSTHVQDVVDVILSEDLTDVVLAGHSYGGQVISGVVRHVQDRIRHVAYLDAVLPTYGENGMIAGQAFWLKEAADQGGDGWRIPVPEPIDGRLMGVTSPDDIRWMLANLTDHPLATFEEPVLLDPQNPYPVPGSYAICMRPGEDGPSPGNVRNARRAQELGWPVSEIATGHDLMVSEPQQTADFLVRAAG